MKNAIIYRLERELAPFASIGDMLAPHAFMPCGASQESSMGWMPPRGEEHGPLIESVAGQWILKFMIEVKKVPSEVLDRKVKEQVAQIEVSTGRKPGRKELREIKDDARLALLPMAFTSRSAVKVWIDPVAQMMVLDTSSNSKADDVITLLVRSISDISMFYLNTNESPTSAMSAWLSTMEAPAGFSIDRECELKASDESKAVVRYKNHPLDIEEVQQHIASGKQPTKLALTWNDRVSFVLTDGLHIKGVTFLESVFEQASESHADNFDADAAIVTGELQKLIPALIEALGGEPERQAAGSVYPLDSEVDPLPADAMALLDKWDYSPPNEEPSNTEDV